MLHCESLTARQLAAQPVTRFTNCLRGVLPLLVLLAGGCAHGTYKATQLPLALQPQPPRSARQIDLSALPRSSTPSDWLGSGDVVELSIATGAEKGDIPNWKLRVNEQGQIDVPLVGVVAVTGISAADAAERIRAASIERGVYVDPKVTVDIEEKFAARITVVGAVKAPATYELPLSECHLLGALTAAEGLAVDADTTLDIRHSQAGLEKQIARQQQQQRYAQRPGPDGQIAPMPLPDVKPNTTIDLEQISQLEPNQLELFDGTVVHVHRRDPRRVYVDGLVRTPKAIDLPEGEPYTLLQAISQAGGVTNSLASKVLVVRQNEAQGTPAVIEASLKTARHGGADNLVLREGDIVTVAETPATYITDAMRSFFRVGFSAAMPGF